MVLPVEGAFEGPAPAADGGEVGLVAAAVPRRGVSVGDVGGLLEGEAFAVVVLVAIVDLADGADIKGEVVEVLLRGDLVAAVGELREVSKVDVAIDEVLIEGACIVACARDDDTHIPYIPQRISSRVRVAHGVVSALGEHVAVVGDGRRLKRDRGAVPDVQRLDTADDGVVVVERLIGHIVEDDLPKFRTITIDGDGNRMFVAAHRDIAVRNISAVQFLDRGTVEP